MSFGSRESLSKRPGRVSRPGLLVCALAVACSTDRPGASRLTEIPLPVASIGSEYALPEGARDGILLLRGEWVDGDGAPDRGMSGVQALRLFSEATRHELVIHATSRGALADFCVALPAGEYRTIATTGTSPERMHLLRFAVYPGTVSYAGTIRFHRQLIRAPYFTLHDDYDGVVARFAASHPALGTGVRKRLLEAFDCGRSLSRDCDPEPGPGAEPAEP